MHRLRHARVASRARSLAVGRAFSPISLAEDIALKHESRILGQWSNPVSGFSMMEQVILCAVWPMENWPGSSLNQIQGWNNVR